MSNDTDGHAIKPSLKNNLNCYHIYLHRDIKPENIMLSGYWKACLAKIKLICFSICTCKKKFILKILLLKWYKIYKNHWMFNSHNLLFLIWLRYQIHTTSSNSPMLQYWQAHNHMTLKVNRLIYIFHSQFLLLDANL